MTTWRASSTLAGERPQAWQDMAACRNAVVDGLVGGPDADPWFPRGDKALAAQALAFCQRCPVMYECEQERKAARISEGVWAGRQHCKEDALAQRRERNGGLTIWTGRMDAYRRGLPDQRIADLECCKVSTISKWRSENNLPVNAANGRVNARRQELYDQGLTDRQIGQLLKCSAATISSWRRRAYLPVNADPINGWGRKQADVVRDDRRTELLARGLTDAAAAKSEGISQESFRNWRELRKIPRNMA